MQQMVEPLVLDEVILVESRLIERFNAGETILMDNLPINPELFFKWQLDDFILVESRLIERFSAGETILMDNLPINPELFFKWQLDEVILVESRLTEQGNVGDGMLMDNLPINPELFFKWQLDQSPPVESRLIERFNAGDIQHNPLMEHFLKLVEVLHFVELNLIDYWFVGMILCGLGQTPHLEILYGYRPRVPIVVESRLIEQFNVGEMVMEIES